MSKKMGVAGKEGEDNTIGRYHKLEDKDQEEKKVRIEKRNKGSQLGVL